MGKRKKGRLERADTDGEVNGKPRTVSKNGKGKGRGNETGGGRGNTNSEPNSPSFSVTLAPAN